MGVNSSIEWRNMKEGNILICSWGMMSAITASDFWVAYVFTQY